MSKPDLTELDGDLRLEFDPAILKNGVRGKYYDRFLAGTNLVLLEPDVAQAFPTSESVNKALKMLMRVAESSSKLPAA